MLPVLQIGGLTLRTPGLVLLAGLWLGLEFASREGMKRGIDGDRIYSIGFYTLLGGVLGARLGFVLLHPDLYFQIKPWTRAILSVFALAPGTEVAWMGVLVALGLAIYLARQWKLPLLTLADSFTPGLAILGIGIGLANLLSGDYYGVETDLPWGINLWGAKRHPTQLYFALACGSILAVLWWLRSHKGSTGDYQPGLAAQIFAILLGLAILLIEPLRADSPVIGPGIRLWSVIALIGLAGSLAGFAYRAPGHPR